jgi:hypothetical protein
MRKSSLFLLVLLLVVLAACSSSASMPPEIRSAIEQWVNVDEGVGFNSRLSPDWSIRDAQKATSPQNYFRFQNAAEEAWCIVIQPAIVLTSGYGEVKNFLAYRIGLTWYVESSYTSIGANTFTNVGCTNFDATNEFGSQ